MKYGHSAMDLKRKDMPENKAFWESVEQAPAEWRLAQSEWTEKEGEKRDLLLVLVYLATKQGIKAIDMSRDQIARTFLAALICLIDYPWILQTGLEHFLKNPFIDHFGMNKRLSHMLVVTAWHRDHRELCDNLFHLLKFKRREYVGPPESEVWYASDFEEYLKDLNKTRSSDFTMSVKDARTAENILSRLSGKERRVLEEIANMATKYLNLV